jgi:hypothetical protein
MGLNKAGFSQANCAVKPTRLRRSAYFRSLDPEAKKRNPELTTGANREKALRHRGDAMLEK